MKSNAVEQVMADEVNKPETQASNTAVAGAINDAITDSFERMEQFFGAPYDTDNGFNIAKAVRYDEQDCFPIEHIDEVRKAGLFAYFVPQAHGGKLNRFDELALLCRTLSRRDLATAIAVGQSFLGALPVWLAGSAAQRAQLAKQLLGGGLGCLALTEKAHGSDIFATEVTATERDGSLQISGQKWLINNATQGQTMSLLVKKIDQRGGSELSLLYLDKQHLAPDRFKNIDKIKTHGIRGADISGIEFDQCEVSHDTVVRSSEATIYSILKGLQVSRILCAGFSMGAMDTALRVTLDFALQRQLYGKSIVAMAPVKKTLTNQFCRVLAADVVSQVCSRAINYHPGQLSLWSAICKYYVPVTSEQTVTQLRVVLGARNYLREEHCNGVFQKLARDNEVVALFDGSTQINLGIIAGQLSAIANRFDALETGTPDSLTELFALQLEPSRFNVLDAQQFALSNNGMDALMEAFVGVIVHAKQAGGDNSDTAKRFTPAAWRCIKQVLALFEQLCAEVRSLDAAGHRDPGSFERFHLAENYIQIWAAAAVVLMWYHNEQSNSLFNSAILEQVLVNVLAGITLSGYTNPSVSGDTMDKVMEHVERVYEQNLLFSLRPLRLN